MAILDYIINIDPFWDDEYLHLNYEEEEFNNTSDTERWLKMGYRCQFTGAMCDMRKPQPSWNNTLPTHQDTYKRYVELFNLQGKEYTIRRAIVFLEDWASGHYLELKGQPVTGWKKGFTPVWAYDAPHMAANIGATPRYTLQITGHV